jgi:hypothetical protein
MDVYLLEVLILNITPKPLLQMFRAIFRKRSDLFLII